MASLFGKLASDCLLRALMVPGLALWLVGCASGGPGKSGAGKAEGYSEILRKDDLVEVKFSGSPSPPTEKSERIKGDGTIDLPLIGAVKAEGKTRGQLQEEIQKLYVPKYYRQLTVTVNTESRYFYVYGEVRAPDRIYYNGQITVLQAIAAAGGFTDFAARTRVELTRVNGERHIINAKSAAKRPEMDLAVFPGDTINVPRRGLWGGS